MEAAACQRHTECGQVQIVFPSSFYERASPPVASVARWVFGSVQSCVSCSNSGAGFKVYSPLMHACPGRLGMYMFCFLVSTWKLFCAVEAVQASRFTV